MSNFKDSPYFNIHNDYYTPKSAWKNIQHLIPKDKIIYEAFMLNSNEQSKKYLQELGYNVVGDKTIDFLTNDLDKDSYDIVVSNPPFERIRSFKKRKTNLKYMCIQKLLDNDKPFIILINSMNLCSKWFSELFKDKDIKIIYPKKKINYDKYESGGINKIETKKNNCSFISVYISYKVVDKNEWI